METDRRKWRCRLCTKRGAAPSYDAAVRALYPHLARFHPGGAQ